MTEPETKTRADENPWETRFNRAFAFGIYLLALFLPFSISGAQGAMGFLMAVWIVSAVALKRIGGRFTPIGPILLLFLIWTLIAAFFAVHPEVTFGKLRRYWIFLGYFALVRAFVSREVAVRALKILVACAGVTAIYGISQHLWGNAVPRFLAKEVDLYQKTGGYFHAVGLFDHHLTYGNSLILILLAGVGLCCLFGWKKGAIPYAAATGLSLVAVVYSYARSAWLGLLAGIFVFGFQLGKRVLIPVAVVAGLLIALAVSISPSVRFRFEKTVSVEDNLERIAIWATTVDMIRDHPWFGIGRGNYARLTTEYRLGYNVHWTARSHAHNSYFMVGAESGIVAALLLIAWLAVLLTVTARQAARMKTRPEQRLFYSFFAVHTAFAVSSFFQHNLGDAEVAMTWLFLTGLQLGIGDLEARKQETEDNFSIPGASKPVALQIKKGHNGQDPFKD